MIYSRYRCTIGVLGGTTANFSTEFITAARTYMGQKVIPHQNFAGNCYEQPSDFCSSNGLGPEIFDCSGLVLRAMSDAGGVPLEMLTPYRHVRDMWRTAHVNGQGFFRLAEPQPGNLLITARRYDIAGQLQRVPGHVGIITACGSQLGYIHSNAERGKVEERWLRSMVTVLGYLAVDLA